MRYVYFANNLTGLRVLEWLVAIGDSPVGIVVHPLSRAVLRDDIVQVSGLSPECVFDGSTLAEPATLEALARLAPACGVSVSFGYILRTQCLSLFPRGCINLHPSLLPYNRGQSPNIWSIVEGTPSGVTLHYMDGGVDTGDIIEQRDVPKYSTDTGETLYRRLLEASVQLFQEAWPAFKSGRSARRTQSTEGVSCHRAADLETLDRIDLTRSYVAKDLINLLRARTFPPHRGAYFVDGGRRVYVSVQLWQDEDR